ncbi:MAG: hypothetical protein ACFFDI_31040, partial [Promethearchaeota archaeon]
MKGKRINQLGIIIFLILIPLFNITLNFHLINSTSTDLSTFNGYGNKKSLWKSEKSTTYTPDFTGTGENCNITLEQSLVDTSVITISNMSDPTNNSFYEPCPTAQNFPSSLVNMTIEDIYASNKSFIIEDDVIFKVLEPVSDHYVSITLRGTGYIENISFYVNRTTTYPTKLNVYLYNAENVSGLPRPYRLVPSTLIATSNIILNKPHWLNLTGIHTFYNCSETFQDTFFLQVEKVGGSTEIEMFGYYDILDGDDQIVLDSAENLHLSGGQPVDVGLKISLSPYIYPANQTLIVEDSAVNHMENPTTSRPCATSFQVTGNMYLENVSARLWTDNPGIDNEVKFVLYNSTWDSSNSTSIPGGHYLNDYIDLGNINYTANGWVTITGLHEYLDNSKTDNNTWFIGIWDIDEGTADANWYYTITGVGDTIDETRSYKYHTFYGYWEPVRYPDPPWEDYEVDFWLKLDLRPPNNIPNPENINLKINNSAVMGYPNEY